MYYRKVMLPNGGGALMSPVDWKKEYGLTWIRFKACRQTSSRSSIMHTMLSPQGNNALKYK